jgi:hypothetical protein
MAGVGNNPVPDRGAEILYRVTMNTLGALTTAGLTKDNFATGQAQANTRLDSATTPRGILAGSVVKVVGNGQIGAATASTDQIVGIAINNAVGNPFESASGVGSGKVPYIHGSGSVISVDLYETHDDQVVPVAINYAATAGSLVYSSQNGFLAPAAGFSGGVVNAIAVGIILKAPTTSDPTMVVQLLR